MRKSFFYATVALLMLAFSISSCSSDDDSAPVAEEPIVEEPIAEDSVVEGSVVGYWQLVGEFNGNQQKPLTDVTVAKFGGNGVLTYYENGRPTNRMTYWLEPTEESSNLYGFHCGNSPELEGAYAGGANLLIDGDMLRIHSFGCFLNQTCFYRRIASLDDVDPALSSILYEDNPTTLEGTWYMTQVNTIGDVSLSEPWMTWVHFSPDKTIQVVNELVVFLPSDAYSYEVVEGKEYSGEAYTKIDIEGQGTFTYSFIGGMLLLDDGKTSGGRVYCFRKLKEKE